MWSHMGPRDCLVSSFFCLMFRKVHVISIMNVICVSHQLNWGQNQVLLLFCLMILLVFTKKNTEGKMGGERWRRTLRHVSCFYAFSFIISVAAPPSHQSQWSYIIIIHLQIKNWSKNLKRKSYCWEMKFDTRFVNFVLCLPSTLALQ